MTAACLVWHIWICCVHVVVVSVACNHEHKQSISRAELQPIRDLRLLFLQKERIKVKTEERFQETWQSARGNTHSASCDVAVQASQLSQRDLGSELMDSSAPGSQFLFRAARADEDFSFSLPQLSQLPLIVDVISLTTDGTDTSGCGWSYKNMWISCLTESSLHPHQGEHMN